MGQESEKGNGFPRVVIAGAGPAGLTAAAELVRLRDGDGRGITLLEADPQRVGGISKTVCHHGFRFDIGGHRFFSKNPEITRWWEERLPDDFLTVKRQSRILYRGRFFDYPLKPWNALSNLGLTESGLCVLSYSRRKLLPLRPEVSFRDWVTNRFGDRLYQHFFKTYTEKVWGISCEELSADWAAQRIKGLSLYHAVWNAFFKPSGGKVVKTLIDRFQYPRLGPGMMWEKTRDDLTSAGVEIRMGREVKRIHCRGNRAAAAETLGPEGKRETWPAEEFILSMPLRETVLALGESAPEPLRRAGAALRYRDFLTVALILRGPKTAEGLFPDNWIYIHDPQVKAGRIQNFYRWSPEMVPQTEPGARMNCLGMEYFCGEGDAFWRQSDESLKELARGELERLELLPKGTECVDSCVIRMPKAYPVYAGDYRRDLGIIREEMGKYENIQQCGRNGLHQYNNQDHSMLTGMLAARNIQNGGSRENVWHVNEDAQYLESGPAVQT